MWQLNEILTALNLDIESKRSSVINGIKIDSREITVGDLFIAIEGENNDGHAFIEEALSKGATIVIGALKNKEQCQQRWADISGIKFIYVPDTTKALWDLAQFARQRSTATIIGITGSFGKTTLKEMVYHVLSQQLGANRVYRSYKNYNNHYGLPLMLANLPPNIAYGIFELGMQYKGEIERLSKLLQPHISMITTIGSCHESWFKDGVQGITKAKAEIFSGQGEDGVAIINGDVQYFDLLLSYTAHLAKVITFGYKSHNKVQINDLNYGKEALTAKITAKKQYLLEAIDFSRNRISNSGAIVALIEYLGLDVGQALDEASSFSLLDGRGHTQIINHDSLQIKVIDESYNACPATVELGIERLSALPGSRKILVLGEMYELSNPEQDHLSLLPKIKASNIDGIYTCGPMIKPLYDKLKQLGHKVVHYDDPNVMAGIIMQDIKSDDVYLVKGSRGPKPKPRMKIIVEKLTLGNQQNRMGASTAV